MNTKILKTSLLSLAMVSGAVNAAQVAGTVNSKGNTQMIRSGVSQSVNNSSAVYMIDDQLITSKKAIASLSLKNGNPQLVVLPETKLSVSKSSPLGLDLQSGLLNAKFKPAQTLAINTPSFFASAKALTAGELVAKLDGDKLVLVSKSGSFSIVDSNGISRTLNAADKKGLVMGQDKSEFVNVQTTPGPVTGTAGTPAGAGAAGAGAGAGGAGAGGAGAFGGILGGATLTTVTLVGGAIVAGAIVIDNVVNNEDDNNESPSSPVLQ